MPVSRSDIEKAFGTYRPEEALARKSTKWDVIHPTTGERLPPKVILDTAARIAGELPRNGTNYRSGGPQTNGILWSHGFQVVLKPGADNSEEAEDIEAVLNGEERETTKIQLVNARLGQGSFREALMERWDRKCALTRCEIDAVLRASHIKPWRASTNSERLNPDNGLLLVASIDALFDRHLITITETGKVLAAKAIPAKALESLGLPPGKTVSLAGAMEGFLQSHRKEFRRTSGDKSYIH